MRASSWLLMAAPLLLASAVSAQTPTVAGTYLIEFDMRIEMSGGTPQVTERGKAHLVLEQRGDSVFGTWTVTDADHARPPRKLQGRMQNGALKLNAEPTEARINVNGEEQRVMVAQTFEATVSGSAISGTITSDGPLPGMPPLTRKFEGKRQG